MNQKGFIPILIVVLIAVAALGGGFWIYQSNLSTPPNPSPVACTQDAKLCPDGSYVSRVGPNCEFAPCPTPSATSSAETTNWKTYTNAKYQYSVKYPSDWEVTSITATPLPENVRFTKILKQNGKYVTDTTADIIVEANPAKKSATKQWYLEWVKNIPAGIDTTRFTFKEINFQEYPGLMVNNKELFFAKDSYMFKISWSVAGDYDNSFVKSTETVFDQILSTFKFLE